MGKLIKEFSLKECWLRSPSQHQKRSFNIIFGWHVASEEWWARYCCLLHALEMYLFSLSFLMTTFALFLSYENPTSCSFHRILLPEIHNLWWSSIPFPELTDILLREQSETSGGYWYKHKLEGAMYSSYLSFRKYIPRAINPPPPPPFRK